MGDKFDNKNKHKGKKPSKKDLKAQNHLKLMEGHKKDNQDTSKTVSYNADKDKKAA